MDQGRNRRRWFGLAGLTAMCIAVTVYAAGGTKRTSETCANDGECDKGHCYTKKNGDKVCVDCSPDTIARTRDLTDKWCKDASNFPRKCDNIPQTQEASEAYFKLRIANNDQCISIRKDENSACWNGADQGHRDQVDEAERGRKNCYDELNTRSGNGGIYTCSDSTYTSEAAATESTCRSWGKGCEDWSKDDKVINCREVEDAIKNTDNCVVAVQRLDSDCLSRVSSYRDSQFSKAKKAYDNCKDILAYKTTNKFCK
jgi:hypothetical protein